MIEKIVLCDTNQKVVEAWEKIFKSDLVEITRGSVFEQKADALVAPGNSFAYMDGGLDWEICKYFGNIIQPNVQREIKKYKKNNTFLPVGEAILVKTNDTRFPYLIYAPTMDRPKHITGTDNVYKATKAIFECCKEHPFLKSVAIPGLGTGVGNLLAEKAAEQMWKGFIESIAGYQVKEE